MIITPKLLKRRFKKRKRLKKLSSLKRAVPGEDFLPKLNL